MSTFVDTNVNSNRPTMLKSIIIAGVAAFVLGALSAFVTKAAYSGPSAPVAASGAAPVTMEIYLRDERAV